MAYPYYGYLPPPPVFETPYRPQPFYGGYPPIIPSPTFYGYSSPTSFQQAWAQDPPGTFRTMVEWDTNSEKNWPMCTHFIEPYTKNADFLKVLMSILKGRLGCEFPQNFKAIVYLEKVPAAELAGVHDELKKIVDAGTSLRGHNLSLEPAKALFEKAKDEKKKKEDEGDEKKKVEEMWKKFMGESYGGGWPYSPAAAPPAWPGYGPSYIPYAFYPRPS
ncbi:hypothetical protein L198_04419 [Cryptococcus wingfieldii CBS 7118]|uniref:Uncharacterized protein n=1 Tax=Cryptococcus wingfieldii CBS 7118 TaxID=1295528 RepID=A0A1E3J794_9TREE|nr:hypothetical protein L198_04419 [Cryptococcus wingfieldii CBS 7118]ODN95801.1 hypothetical protein L198_04419 [Cryptococcus wingfieldii CBS 7118]